MLGPARPSRPLEQFFFLVIVSDVERTGQELYSAHICNSQHVRLSHWGLQLVKTDSSFPCFALAASEFRTWKMTREKKTSWKTWSWCWPSQPRCRGWVWSWETLKGPHYCRRPGAQNREMPVNVLAFLFCLTLQLNFPRPWVLLQDICLFLVLSFPTPRVDSVLEIYISSSQLVSGQAHAFWDVEMRAEHKRHNKSPKVSKAKFAFRCFHLEFRLPVVFI